jgi:hypothetical protein
MYSFLHVKSQSDGDNENGDSQQQLLSSDGPDSSGKKKEQRSNAKSVECFDLSGNLLYVFKSGMIASQTLNISQGDISQCCRGIKRSHMGYKFRFFGDAADRKKGSWKEGDSNQRADLMRSTRQANRWSGAAEGCCYCIVNVPTDPFQCYYYYYYYYCYYYCYYYYYCLYCYYYYYYYYYYYTDTNTPTTTTTTTYYYYYYYYYSYYYNY